jgi:predicted amidohydrolase YtcJ
MNSAVGADGVVAERVLVSARVYTMAASGSPVTAVAIADGKITATGGQELVERLRSAGTEVVDVGERPILPGLIDAHVHYEIESVALATSVSIHTPPCTSIDDIVTTLRENADRSDTRGGWLVGEGNLMQDQRLQERRVPNRHDLDKVSTTVPIALRIGGHTTAMNSRALELADFGRRTKLSRAALLERDERGELTGVAREVFYDLPIPVPEGDAMRETLVSGMRQAFTRYGVTTIGEIPRTVRATRLMHELVDAGSLPCRIRAFVRPEPGMTVEETIDIAREWQHTDEARFRVQGIKLFADGGLTAATAATLRPYAIRRGSRGRLKYTAHELQRYISSIAEASLQPMVHAVGERAQIAVCDAVRAAGVRSLPPRRRPRVEHAGNFVSGHQVLDAWEAADIVPVPNIVMLYSFGAFMPRYLGRYGTRGRFPLKMLIEQGWRLPSGSDITGDEPQSTNPMFGVWTAVARQSVSGQLVEPEQALTVDQALRMYTVDAAAALGDDHLGTLEPGQRADLVVLDRDPHEVDPDQLPDIRPELVIHDGEVVHATEAAARYAGATLVAAVDR